MQIMVKESCTNCGGTGYIVSKATFGYDSKCLACNGYGFVLCWETIPDDACTITYYGGFKHIHHIQNKPTESEE